MTRLRRHVARTGRFWLALLAILALLQGVQPLLHAHPPGTSDDASVFLADTAQTGFALHLPDTELTHALAERSGPAPLTVTAECERCRSIDGLAMPALAPPTVLAIAPAPDAHLPVPRVVRTIHRGDPFDPARAPRGPPAT